ncbi:TonB-dependent siderophore receptor [Nostoc sp. NMS8]|uniref:TonB-dependent siderophore receptor n=1 Tax=Nostoc sp. NMS8 TaxID=2815392 RepID=UPI0025E2DCF4|nr:TonB-dependent siderophore receptor [Nostoc sp. NMS8]
MRSNILQQPWRYFIFNLGMGIFVHLLLTQAALAESKQSQVITKIPTVVDFQALSTDAKNLLSQNIENDLVVKITQVRVNTTNKGIDLILETTASEKLQIAVKSQGNNFIADIKNAQLFLPSGNKFSQQRPAQGITAVTATNFDANTIRLTVTGEAGLPVVELYDSPREGLVFAVASAAASGLLGQQPLSQQSEPQQPLNQTQPQQPSAEGDEPIELVVTGEQDGYRVPNASAATRTDTPLRDIPQSIQVIPQEVLQDQQVTSTAEALKNITGLTISGAGGANTGTSDVQFKTRGFDGNAIRNGLPTGFAANSIEVSNIERIELLKGPASVLFGQGSPGGTLNVITKQPLRDPFYAIEATVGSDDLYRAALDLSGPLNNSKTVLYRLNTSYLDRDATTDFFNNRVFFIAPVLRWDISEKTNLTLEADYTDQKTENPVRGLPAEGTVLANPNGKIPLNRYIGEPDSNQETKTGRVGYKLEHQLSDNWSFRNAFNATFFRYNQDKLAFPVNLQDDKRTLDRIGITDYKEYYNAYNLTTDVIGKFSTGSVRHQLLFGVDLSRTDTIESSGKYTTAPSIDLFNPVYGQPLGTAVSSQYKSSGSSDALGVYVQDQVNLTNNLKLLLGGRFDTSRSTGRDDLVNTESSNSSDAFTPRFGIVYQPIEPISLYATYSRSFTPNTGQDFYGNLFEPERGTQYEVGIKADISSKLSATLAFYDLTKSNILTADPDPAHVNFQIQIGEQRSRGIELGLSGEILPGWKFYGGYAYTDAQITDDTDSSILGKKLSNTPENSFNLWTTYEIQKGSLQGLGFGLGFFFVGDRQADLENSFKLPSYFTTDAAIFYKRGHLRTQLNFKNLFDVDYFDTALNQLRVFPGEPFTVQGTISWEF